MASLLNVTNELIIQWNLGNNCNLDCSYCHADLKDGSNPFPNIDRLRPAFAHLLEQARAFSLIKLEIPGGEPTESIALKELMLENTSPEIHFKLYSNAQAKVAWWKAVAPKLYQVELTYHSTTNLEHFLEVIDAVHDTTQLTVLVPHTPTNWNEANHAYTTINKKINNVKIQLLFKDHTRGNSQYLDYTGEQWAIYFKSIGVDPANTEQVADTEEYKKIHFLNNFYGHLCWAGTTQIIVDNFGYVYRGWCKSNGHMGNVFDQTFVIYSRPKPCPKTQCKNGFDLQARKSEGSWGMA